MAPTRPAKSEIRLMHGMADTLSADLEAALADGRLDADELARMAEGCDACAHHDDCILWLVEQGGAAEAAPRYCVNGERLAGLAAALAP